MPLLATIGLLKLADTEFVFAAATADHKTVPLAADGLSYTVTVEAAEPGFKITLQTSPGNVDIDVVPTARLPLEVDGLYIFEAPLGFKRNYKLRVFRTSADVLLKLRDKTG